MVPDEEDVMKQTWTQLDEPLLVVEEDKEGCDGTHEGQVELQGDCISGVCCPIEISFQHVGLSKSGTVVVFLFLLSFAATLLFEFYSSKRYNELHIDAFVTEDGEAYISDEDMKDLVSYYVDITVAGINYLAFTFAVYIIGVLYYFFKVRGTKRLTSGPSLLGRILCPAPTVYYHERNTCNHKTCLALLFGCCYTGFFYRPSYESEISCEHCVDSKSVLLTV